MARSSFALARSVIIAWLGCLVLVATAHAQAVSAALDRKEKTETDGVALTGGFGSSYVAAGVQAAYYVQIPKSLFRVAGYVSVGIVPIDQTPPDHLMGVAIGALGSWGHKHRFVLEPFAGPVEYVKLQVHGQAIDAHNLWGFGLLAGYEYVSFGGFVFRIGLGPSYAFLPPLFRSENKWVPALSIGFGYKIF